jgi:hypothetical protein
MYFLKRVTGTKERHSIILSTSGGQCDFCRGLSGLCFVEWCDVGRNIHFLFYGRLPLHFMTLLNLLY